MNYTSLTQDIIAWTNRNEPTFVSQIPNIIQLATDLIYSEVKTIGFQKTTLGQMTQGAPVIDKPIDFKSPIHLKITLNLGPNSNHKFLLERPYEFCVLYSPFVNVEGEPVFYSTDLDVPQQDVVQPTLYLSPTPDDNYQYELSYLSFPPPFDINVSKTYLTDKYPTLLLSACLYKTIPYLKSDERVQLFQTMYAEAKAAVNGDTQSRYIDRYSNRGKD